MSKPVEYRMAIAGFGVWRIAFAPDRSRWILSCNAWIKGEQWVPVGDHAFAETAALAVAERKTGLRTWDGLRYPASHATDLNRWKTDNSEGAQADAID